MIPGGFLPITLWWQLVTSKTNPWLEAWNFPLHPHLLGKGAWVRDWSCLHDEPSLKIPPIRGSESSQVGKHMEVWGPWHPGEDMGATVLCILYLIFHNKQYTYPGLLWNHIPCPRCLFLCILPLSFIMNQYAYTSVSLSSMSHVSKWLNPKRRLWELWSIGGWSEVQVIIWDLQVASEVGVVLWDWALNLWNLTLTPDR